MMSALGFEPNTRTEEQPVPVQVRTPPGVTLENLAVSPAVTTCHPSFGESISVRLATAPLYRRDKHGCIWAPPKDCNTTTCVMLYYVVKLLAATRITCWWRPVSRRIKKGPKTRSGDYLTAPSAGAKSVLFVSVETL